MTRWLPGVHCQELVDLNQFVHELDRGVAPGVGFVWNVDASIHTVSSALVGV